MAAQTRPPYTAPPCRYVPKAPPATGDALKRRKRWAAAMRAYVFSLRKAWLIRERKRRGDARWWPSREERHPYLWFEPHAEQARFIYGQADVQIAYTGNRGAKTWALGCKVVHAATGIPAPWFLAPRRVPYLKYLNRSRDPKRRLPWIGLVTSHKAKSRDEAIGKIILDMLPDEWRGAVKRDNGGYLEHVDIVLGLPGEQPSHICRLLFFAQTQTEAALMGLSVNFAVIDEELKNPRADIYLGEVLARLTDRHGYLWYGFTPIDSAIRGGATHIVNDYIKPFREGRADLEKLECFQWSTHANTHLPPEVREDHDRKYRNADGSKRWDYALRVLGEPVGAGLSPAIHPEYVDWQKRNAVRPHVAQGRLADTVAWSQRGRHTNVAGWGAWPVGIGQKNVDFIPDPNGQLWIYRHPEPGHHYTLGCDTGTGTPGRNPTAAVVLDRTSGEVVALLWGLIDAARIVPELVRLGHFYNTAWICVERAHVGYAVVSWMTGFEAGGLTYPKLYHHDRAGGYADVTDTPGYPMGPAEQAFMLATINAALKPEHGIAPIRVLCERVVTELGSASYDEKDHLIYPPITEGEVVTHCDAMVAFGLAVIAHRSRACELLWEAAPPKRIADPVRQAVVDEFEELLQQQSNQRGGWRESSNGWRGR